MSQTKPTLGAAIDQVLTALEPLDEKGRTTVLATVCSHLGIFVGASVGSGSISSATGGGSRADALLASGPAAGGSLGGALLAGGSARAAGAPLDIRLFKEEKAPKNAIQMACVVAF